MKAHPLCWGSSTANSISRYECKKEGVNEISNRAAHLTNSEQCSSVISKLSRLTEELTRNRPKFTHMQPPRSRCFANAKRSETDTRASITGEAALLRHTRNHSRKSLIEIESTPGRRALLEMAGRSSRRASEALVGVENTSQQRCLLSRRRGA